MYNEIKEAFLYIQDRIKAKPQTAIILGSGLGIYVDQMEDKIVIPYSEIPHFAQTTVVGHKGQFVYGKVRGKDIAVFQGRFHAYEGHPLSRVVLPVRILADLGIKNLILTNASGGINANYRPGDLVYITDHINMTGKNPLLGENLAELGPRFPDMSETYQQSFIKLIKESAQSMGLNILGGVYAGVLGPSYETPAEIRMLRSIGADLVGMSTVPEAIAASHAGLNLAGISCITNYAAGISQEKLRHEDVEEVAKQAMVKFSDLLSTIVEKL